ncbi:MAG: serine/threonine-protein kinase, partial [Acidobacteriota bacterium]
DHVFSALSEILPGRVLDGKYRLERKIGKGGFGAVYRAMHIGLNRAVAIKIFRPSPVSRKKGDGVVRFRREGISACRVDHPNAVSVLDFGISRSGIAYLVMELLRGRTLGATLKVRHVLSLRRCVEILTPVCSVLMAASAANVLHRDIKPENIFLHRTEAGEVVKVVDFGIAKLMGDDDEPDAAAAVSSDATGMLSEPMHTTGLIGTPVYMAPERLLSEPYDVRADIYSVGVLLYRMISGRIPFTSKKGGFRLMTEICEKGPRPLREVCPSCPPDVAALVMSAMAQSPDDRPTADELAERFQRAVEQLPAELADYVPEGIQPSGEALRELHTMRTQSGDEGSYAITLPSFSLDEAEAGELAQSGGD